MKLFSKLFCLYLLCLTTSARDIIILSYPHQGKNAQFVISELKKHVPPQLVVIKKESRPCIDKYKDAILHMCLTKDGDLLVVRDDKVVLKEAFKVFKKKDATSSVY